MRLFACLFFYLFFHLDVNAQTSELSDTIAEIVIKSESLNLFENQTQQVAIDNKTSLANQLNRLQAIGVQSNGPGLLATALINGLASRHTAIVWEGFNIQSPVNGTFDLSLLNGFGKITTTSNSLSSYLGTASLGGALLLEDTNEDKLSIHTTYNTMRNSNLGLKTNLKLSDNWSSSVVLNSVRNQNAYQYIFNTEKQRQNDASYDGIDGRLINKVKFGDKWNFVNSVWMQKFDREVAASKVSVYNGAIQEDQNLRVSTSLSYKHPIGLLKIKQAYFNEILNFRDNGIDSQAKTDTYIFRTGLEKANQKLDLQHRIENVDANFFQQKLSKQISRINYQFAFKWSRAITSKIALAEVLTDGVLSPFLFDWSTHYIKGKASHVVTINRSYNTATFNDLFWPMGGNQDLEPESSFGIHLYSKYNLDGKNSIQFKPYFKQVTNWILWSPNNGIWSPMNQRKVVAKGFDVNLNLMPTKSLRLDISLAYNESTIAEDLLQGQLHGKQLIYVPRWRGSISGKYKLKDIEFESTNYFVGKRYTSTDNMESVGAYLISDVSISLQLHNLIKQRIEIQFGVNNIWNKDYEHVRFYAMPLRNFSFNINYNL